MKNPSRDQLKNARDQFASLIARQATERHFQKLFARCPYILSQSLPVRLLPIDILPMGTPGKSEPDFIFFPRTSCSSGEYGVIEIKRPNSVIATLTRKNIVTLSRDAETAISQSQHFLHKFPGETLVKPAETLVLGNQGHIFVIMGLSEQLYRIFADNLLKQQLERRIPANCQLLPYDVLLHNFSKEIDTKVYFLTPAISYRMRIAVLDVMFRHGNRSFSPFLVEIFETFFDSHVTVDYRIPGFVRKLERQAFDLGVIIFNPLVEELPDFWPRIRSLPNYAATPILFVYNDGVWNSAGQPDCDGERLNPYLRLDFDEKELMPFNIQSINDKIHAMLEKRLVALSKPGTVKPETET